MCVCPVCISGLYGLSHFNTTYAHHGDDLWVDLLGDHTSLTGNVIEHLMQRLRLDLLSFELLAGIVEVKHDGALSQLANEQLWSIGWHNL